MIITVEEAKEKVCCKQMPKMIDVCCLADKCMAWEWDKQQCCYDQATGKVIPYNVKKGYCGLSRER